MKTLLFILIFLPFVVSAQESDEIRLGDQVVKYDTIETEGSAIYYFAKDELVASEHGPTAFVYENDRAILEVHDTDGDGDWDAFATLDKDSMVEAITGSGADAFLLPDSTELNDDIESNIQNSEDPDLVGPLDRIDIPRGGLPWPTIVIWLLVMAGGYWWYKNKYRKS